MNQDDIQKQIQNNVDKKEKRYNKTELSIAHRWSVNCAVQMAITKLPPSKKVALDTDEEYQTEIRKWRDWFIEMDREWMMDNMSEEIIPITDKNEFEVDGPAGSIDEMVQQIRKMDKNTNI